MDDIRWDLLAEAVTYVQRVKAMGMQPAAYSKALREPVHFIYELRHDRNKYRSARWRSANSVGVEPGGRRLVFDHAIPFKYVQAALLTLDRVTEEAVEAVLNRLDVPCVITAAEDGDLRSAGLGSKMPDGWTENDDPLARYAAAAIEIVPND